MFHGDRIDACNLDIELGSSMFFSIMIMQLCFKKTNIYFIERYMLLSMLSSSVHQINILDLCNFLKNRIYFYITSYNFFSY